MKKSTIIFKSVLSAFVLFASAALVSCEKEGETPNPDTDATKPVAVQFAYTNVESEDMLEYCNIIMEYTDVNGTKVDTITSTEWKKVCTTPLPCTYSFKKSYTLKEDKDMSSGDTITIKAKSYQYSYSILKANGDEEKKPGGAHSPNYHLIVNKLPEAISQGRFNVTNDFVFDKDGKLTRK